MDWRDYVRTPDRKEFLEQEAKFTEEYLKRFEDEELYVEKEAKRAEVLASRLLFLSSWIREKGITGITR